MTIDTSYLDHKAVNFAIRAGDTEIALTGCCGQRFIAAGMAQKHIQIHGTPGNALGAYLNGAQIDVYGNAQDAVGDTMNEGAIYVHGSIGDAAGYAMRGGAIYVRGNAGYRAGIHMKAYKQKRPALIIGGRCGSFLGEYQAGGLIVVLGLGLEGQKLVGDFPCTGMHGGKVFLRGDTSCIRFPRGVTSSPADANDLSEILPYLNAFCARFSLDANTVLSAPFTKVEPDSSNPYKQMYVAN